MTKTIAGGAAGQQDEVTIEVECDGTALTPDFIIHADTPAGTTSMTYTGIPADSVCTATETVDGHTSTIAAAVTGDNGTPITIPPGGTADAAITDTYTDVSGQLVVNKIITGDGADLHGPITVHVECPTGTPLTPDFTIPAGDPSTSHTYTGLAPGVQCTVTETADGAISGIVDVATTIDQPPPISASGSVEANVTDDYTALIGSLTVTKTIGGPAAGQQGSVTIGVLCVGVPLSQTPPFVIPAGATGPQSRTYPGSPLDTKCFVFEIARRSHEHRCGHRDEPRANRHDNGGGHHRHCHGHLHAATRLHHRRQDPRRAVRRAAGPDHHPRDLPRRGPEPDPRLHDPSRHGCRPAAALLQQRPGRVDVYRHRDRRRGDEYRDDHGDRG